MIRTWSYIVFLALVFLTGNQLQAQNFQFWQPGVSGFPQVAEFQDQFTFYFYLRNTTTSNYSGTLKVRSIVNNDPPVDLDSMVVQNFAVGDSILFVLNNYTITQPAYKLGQNGVVIWIVDDDLTPVSEEDSLDVFIVDRPAFRIGVQGMAGFPPVVSAGDEFDFTVHVENAYDGDYEDSLWLDLKIGDLTYTWQSPGPIYLPGRGGYLFEINDFVVENPPFVSGDNVLRARARGTQNTLSIPNHEQIATFLGPVGRPSAAQWKLGLFPHPIQDYFSLALPPQSRLQQLRLYDVQGRLQLMWDAQHRFELPKAFPSGTYLLQAEFQSGPPIFQRIQVIR